MQAVLDGTPEKQVVMQKAQEQQQAMSCMWQVWPTTQTVAEVLQNHNDVKQKIDYEAIIDNVNV